MDELRDELKSYIDEYTTPRSAPYYGSHLKEDILSGILDIINKAGHVHLDTYLGQPDPHGRTVPICTSPGAKLCDFYNDGSCDSTTCEHRGGRMATRREILGKGV